MNFDQSLHQSNLVRNLILKCALPVMLLALIGTYVLYWTDDAFANVMAAGSFFVKCATIFFNYLDPWIAVLNETFFWKFVVEYILSPIKHIALPLFLILMCVTLIVGCTLNKLKLRGIADQRYEKLVAIWKLLPLIAIPPLLIATLVEANCFPNDLHRLFRVIILLIGCVLMAIHVTRVEKINGDLFKRVRPNVL